MTFNGVRQLDVSQADDTLYPDFSFRYTRVASVIG